MTHGIYRLCWERILMWKREHYDEWIACCHTRYLIEIAASGILSTRIGLRSAQKYHRALWPDPSIKKHVVGWCQIRAISATDQTGSQDNGMACGRYSSFDRKTGEDARFLKSCCAVYLFVCFFLAVGTKQ